MGTTRCLRGAFGGYDGDGFELDDDGLGDACDDDLDGDGIPNDVDECPDEAGDDQGCPQVEPDQPAPQQQPGPPLPFSQGEPDSFCGLCGQGGLFGFLSALLGLTLARAAFIRRAQR